MVGTRLSLLLPLLVNLSLFTVTLGQQAIRINCGSSQKYTDRSGNVWLSDRFNNNVGKTYTSRQSIGGTNDDALYKSERWQTNGQKHIRYEIPVRNGKVNVRLLFAENYVTQRGQRVFDVRIEGTIPSALQNLDVFRKVGKHRPWNSPVHQANVRDGKLSIELLDKIGNPKISAIEVISLGEDSRPSNVHSDIRYVAKVNHRGEKPKGLAWADSYSVGDKCFCDGVTTYDHEIQNYLVSTPAGWKTIQQVCELLGPGPGRNGRPLYNDVQCGNGPPNNAGDEHTCPGRVDMGFEGCGHIGPRWNFKHIASSRPTRSRYFLDTGGPLDDTSLITSSERTWPYDLRNDNRNNIEITNNGGIPVTVYETHRSSKELEYTLKGFEPASPYQVALGFAEVWAPNCQRGKRVMRIKVNGNPYPNLDVFAEAGKEAGRVDRGCGRALIKKYVLTANGRGEIVVYLMGLVENAMLSSIDVIPVG